MEIRRARGYGSYILSARYYGKNIEIHTNDSEIYDWLEDDSNKQMHEEAKKHAYILIKAAYERS